MKRVLLLLGALALLGLGIAWRFGRSPSDAKPDPVHPTEIAPSTEPNTPAERLTAASEVVAESPTAPKTRTAVPSAVQNEVPPDETDPDSPSSRSSKDFHVKGQVVARDGTPLPNVHVYAFRTQDLLKAGITPSALSWERARHLLGMPEAEALRLEQKRRAQEEMGHAEPLRPRTPRYLHAGTNQKGAFVLRGPGAVPRTLIASSPLGSSQPVSIETEQHPVIVRLEVCRLTLRLDGAESLASQRAVLLQTKEGDESRWTPRYFDSDWRMSWLVAPKSRYQLELLPGVDRPQDLGWAYRQGLASGSCDGPLEALVAEAGLRLSQVVRMPAGAAHHEVALVLPLAIEICHLELVWQPPESELSWFVKVYDFPVPKRIGTPCFQAVLEEECFPVSLDLPVGKYCLRYSAVGQGSKERDTINLNYAKKPETWIQLDLKDGETHTELLNLGDSAKVEFRLELHSRSEPRLDLVETTHQTSDRAVQHDVLLVSPDGHEKAGTMEFFNAGRKRGVVLLDGVPRREFAVGTWSFFMNDSELGTLSAEFEVLAGQENLVTLTGELP